MLSKMSMVIYNNFGKILVKFCNDDGLVLFVISLLGGTQSYTFLIEAHKTVSWSDHDIDTTNGKSLL